MAKSKLEDTFLSAWEEYSVFGPAGVPARELLFNEDRGWRFDFAWPAVRVAVETHGFGYGHQRIASLQRDAEKMRAALLAGWTVIPFTSACLGSRERRELAIWETCEIIQQKGIAHG